MHFNFRNIDNDKFIGVVEQSHDFLNVLKFFNEERIPMTIVTYKEHEDEDVYEDYIVEDFFLTLLHDSNYKYYANITVRVREDED
jgi:hypothetical protein